MCADDVCTRDGDSWYADALEDTQSHTRPPNMLKVGVAVVLCPLGMLQLFQLLIPLEPELL